MAAPLQPISELPSILEAVANGKTVVVQVRNLLQAGFGYQGHVDHLKAESWTAHTFGTVWNSLFKPRVVSTGNHRLLIYLSNQPCTGAAGRVADLLPQQLLAACKTAVRTLPPLLPLGPTRPLVRPAASPPPAQAPAAGSDSSEPCLSPEYQLLHDTALCDTFTHIPLLFGGVPQGSLLIASRCYAKPPTQRHRWLASFCPLLSMYLSEARAVQLCDIVERLQLCGSVNALAWAVVQHLHTCFECG